MFPPYIQSAVKSVGCDFLNPSYAFRLSSFASLPALCDTDTTTMAGLVDQHVRPNLGTLPWESPLQFLAQGGVNLEESIALILLDACSGKEWEPPELGIPWEYESPTLAMIADVSGLTVLDIRQLNSSQVLVKVEADVIAEFGAFVYKPDWYTSEDSRLTVVEFDWNDHYVWAEIPLSLHCNLDLVIDASTPEQQEVKKFGMCLSNFNL